MKKFLKDILSFIKKYYPFILLIYAITGLVLFWYVGIYNRTRVVLSGDNTVDVTVNTEYIDSGFDVKIGNDDASTKLYSYSSKNNVNTNVLGTYYYEYKIHFSFKTFTIRRTVNVIDNVAPIINVDKDYIEKDYCTNLETSPLSYSAIDNYDGDITDKIVMKEIDNGVMLNVYDSSKNLATKKIDYKYTNLPSYAISLNGGNDMYIMINEKFTDPGYSFKDNCGKEIDSTVKVIGNVDTTKEGTYTLNYYTKYKNKTYTAVRNVIVRSKESLPGYNKSIYLTFDDGPGKYTDKLLSILANHNIKATFFVTNQFPDYQNIIAKEYTGGHAIAVHSYSHKWSIYSNLDSYIQDFNAMNDIIEAQTGARVNIFRFPGGSSNTISRRYSSGIVSSIAEKMQNDGYIYFDWNVDSGDAEGKSSEQIYANVTTGIQRFDNSIVLMHDIQPNTIDIIESIIQYAQDNGYSFKVLSSTSFVFHHRINN